MAHADGGRMRRAALDTCLVVGYNLDSTLRHIGPSVAGVRTTFQSCSRPTCVCYLVHRQLLKSLVLPVMASIAAPYRRLFREYIRSVRVYSLTGNMAFFLNLFWPFCRDQHQRRHYGHLVLLLQLR